MAIYYDITFENMFATYAKFVSDEYEEISWDLVYDDIKDKCDIYKKGYLTNIYEIYSSWIGKILYETLRTDAVTATGPLKITCFDSIDYNNKNCSKRRKLIQHDYNYDSRIIAPTCLKNWRGSKYCINGKDFVIHLTQYDEKDSIRVLLKIIGRLIHEYGVQSEKYEERGLIDIEYRNIMFRAMVVENILNELYTVVEKKYYEFEE